MSVLASVGWLPWVLSGVVTWLCLPGGVDGLSRLEDARRRSARRRLPANQLAGAAGAASAIGCLAIGGWPFGVVTAVGLTPLAVIAVRRLAGRTERALRDDSLALALDLAAVVLQSGQTLQDVLTLVAPVTASSAAVLGRVGGLLRLGADPADAWSVVPADSPVLPVARAAIRSDVSGARLAAAFERCAEHIRAELAAAGVARAARAGTAALAPLALCFLPSFVCLGIVPAVLGIAKTALRQVV